MKLNIGKEEKLIKNLDFK